MPYMRVIPPNKSPLQLSGLRLMWQPQVTAQRLMMGLKPVYYTAGRPAIYTKTLPESYLNNQIIINTTNTKNCP